MSTANTIQARAVQLALAEKGYKEGSRNYNKFAANTYPDVQNQAWCGCFVGDVYRRAGWDSRGLVWMPYVPYIESWAKKIGAWKTTRAQPGDIVVYGFGRTTGQHTGIAYPDESTGGDSYRAIEGNTSSGNAGSQSNGDGVYVRYRKRRDIRGWVDIAKVFQHYKVQADSAAASTSKPSAKPKPAPKPAAKPKRKKLKVDGRFGKETVEQLQLELNSVRTEQVDVDGRAAEDTWKSLQGFLGIKPRDGKIGWQSYKPAELGNGIVDRRTAWGYTGRKSKGSPTVRAWQAKIGMPVKDRDGILYTGTVKEIQSWLNRRLDG